MRIRIPREKTLSCSVFFGFSISLSHTFIMKILTYLCLLQIHYDLAAFHLLREEYKIARHHVFQAKTLFDQLGPTESLLYCRVQKAHLDGYCLATEVAVQGHQHSLTQKLHASIKDQYTVNLKKKITQFTIR